MKHPPRPQFNMNYKEILEAELNKHGLSWCRGCAVNSSHKRGFVLHADKKTIHYDSNVVTRNSLHRGLHEVGHCINDEKGLRRYECEANAEAYATDTMRAYNIPVPRKTVALGKSYVKRFKRFGDNIIKAKKVNA